MQERVQAAVQKATETRRILKEAGILDPFVIAPFSAVAAALTAPTGARGQAGALGAVVGAGLAALAQQEYEKRRAAGEPVDQTDFIPLIRAVLGGLATGGTFRAVRQQQTEGKVDFTNAFLSGAPAGAALWTDQPLVGASIGTMAVPLLASMIPGGFKNPLESLSPEMKAAIRSRVAMYAARMRQEEAMRALRARNISAIRNPIAFYR